MRLNRNRNKVEERVNCLKNWLLSFLLNVQSVKLIMREIDEIIIHCTATPEGREVSVDEIRRWHKAGATLVTTTLFTSMDE